MEDNTLILPLLEDFVNEGAGNFEQFVKKLTVAGLSKGIVELAQNDIKEFEVDKSILRRTISNWEKSQNSENVEEVLAKVAKLKIKIHEIDGSIFICEKRIELFQALYERNKQHGIFEKRLNVRRNIS